MRTLRALIEHVPSDHTQDFIVIGGLNPDLLTRPERVHMGTNDVDLLLQVAFVYDREEQDFSWLEADLTRAGFDDKGSGWRWRLVLDDAHVALELLSDVFGEEGHHAIPLPG